MKRGLGTASAKQRVGLSICLLAACCLVEARAGGARPHRADDDVGVCDELLGTARPALVSIRLDDAAIGQGVFATFPEGSPGGGKRTVILTSADVLSGRSAGARRGIVVKTSVRSYSADEVLVVAHDAGLGLVALAVPEDVGAALLVQDGRAVAQLDEAFALSSEGIPCQQVTEAWWRVAFPSGEPAVALPLFSAIAPLRQVVDPVSQGAAVVDRRGRLLGLALEGGPWGASFSYDVFVDVGYFAHRLREDTTETTLSRFEEGRDAKQQRRYLAAASTALKHSAHDEAHHWLRRVDQSDADLLTECQEIDLRYLLETGQVAAAEAALFSESRGTSPTLSYLQGELHAIRARAAQGSERERQMQFAADAYLSALFDESGALRTQAVDGLRRLRHPEYERVRRLSPILWLAPDERVYPILPHGFAFHGLLGSGDESWSADEKDYAWSDVVPELPAEEPAALSERLGNPSRDEPLIEVRLGRDGEHLVEPGQSQTPLPSWLGDPLTTRGIHHCELTILHGDPRIDDRVTLSGPHLGDLNFDVLRRDRARLLLRAEQRDRRAIEDGLPPARVLYYPPDGWDEVAEGRTPSRYPACLGDWPARPRPPSNVEGRDVLQFWFYYPFDEGTNPHMHDSEHAFLFLDPHDAVDGVVAAGHTGSTPNNIVTTSASPALTSRPPRELPAHMPILVELGKHGSSPDRTFNGRFDKGLDDNAFYGDAWGSRDIASAFGVDELGGVDNEHSFPREPTTILGESEWWEAWRAVSDVTTVGRDDGSGEYALRTLPYYRALGTEDQANLRRYRAPSASRLGPNAQRYELFPLEDMQVLVAMLTRDSSCTRADVEAFLTDHKACFWTRDPSGEFKGPAGVNSAQVPEFVFERMRAWADHPTDKRDPWLHEDYRDPSRIFKLWLFPRFAIGGGVNYEARKLRYRTSIQLADPLSYRPFGKRLLAYRTLELYADWTDDVDALWSLGATYNLFRGRHQGAYVGGAWGGPEDSRRTSIHVGLSAFTWTFRPSGIGPVTMSLRAGLKGDFTSGQLRPITYQLGLSLMKPVVGPRHPLRD